MTHQQQTLNLSSSWTIKLTLIDYPGETFELDTECTLLSDASLCVLWVGQACRCIIQDLASGNKSIISGTNLVGHNDNSLKDKLFTPLKVKRIGTTEVCAIAIAGDFCVSTAASKIHHHHQQQVVCNTKTLSSSVSLMQFERLSQSLQAQVANKGSQHFCLNHIPAQKPRFHYCLGHGMIRVSLQSHDIQQFYHSRIHNNKSKNPSVPTMHTSKTKDFNYKIRNTIDTKLPESDVQSSRKSLKNRRPQLPDGFFHLPPFTEVWFFVPDHIEEFTSDWAAKWDSSASHAPPEPYLKFQRTVMASQRLYDGRWSQLIRNCIHNVIGLSHNINNGKKIKEISERQDHLNLANQNLHKRFCREFDQCIQKETTVSRTRYQNFQFERYIAGQKIPDHRLGPMNGMSLAFDENLSTPIQTACQSERNLEGQKSLETKKTARYLFPGFGVKTNNLCPTYEKVVMPGHWSLLSDCIRRYESEVHESSKEEPNIFVWQACREAVFEGDVRGRFELDSEMETVHERFMSKHAVHGRYRKLSERLTLQKEVMTCTQNVDVAVRAKALLRRMNT